MLSRNLMEILVLAPKLTDGRTLEPPSSISVLPISPLKAASTDRNYYFLETYIH